MLDKRITDFGNRLLELCRDHDFDIYLGEDNAFKSVVVAHDNVAHKTYSISAAPYKVEVVDLDNHLDKMEFRK